MKTLTGQQPKSNMVVHGNKSTTPNWWKKLPSYFKGNLEFFLLYQNVYVSLPQFLVGKRHSKISLLRYSQI